MDQREHMLIEGIAGEDGNKPMSVALGIEISGSSLRAGIGLADGELVAVVESSVDTIAGAANVRRQLPGLVAKVLEDVKGADPDVRAVGAAFGGLVRGDKGVIINSYHLAGWTDFPLGRWLAGQYKVPTVVENDGNAAGYAEAILGAGRGYGRVLYVSLGRGIGGGWIVDGVLDRGQGMGAAEIGHTWVPYPQSRVMTELERIASSWAIGRRARAALEQGERSILRQLAGGDLAHVKATTVYEAATQGDALATHLIADTCDALAMALGNAINMYHPHRVVLGGLAARYGALFWDQLREQTNRYVFEPFVGEYELVSAELGREAAVRGAVLLAWQSLPK